MCIRELVRRTAPDLITTSNDSYVEMLCGEGISSTLLPLFGNIPLSSERNSGWVRGKFQSTGIYHDCKAHWIFGFFGTVHPAWAPEPLFSYIKKAADQAGKSVIIAGIGRLGPGQQLWSNLSKTYGETFKFTHLGEQPASCVSEFLHALDFGIATSPWSLIGKSGTVASMLEHGLPVVVSRDDIHFATGQCRTSASPLLIKMDENLPSRLRSARRESAKPMLPEVARLLLDQLRV
jgi:hypothetical protein